MRFQIFRRPVLEEAYRRGRIHNAGLGFYSRAHGRMGRFSGSGDRGSKIGLSKILDYN